ncbi:MAG: undecaprenyl-diphosphate phosphatase [Treponema sp.]|jgi:undecaprenyl-diphosphatase|nr:undecaprenyl-diphosphate phosphatase [Treponema sp.]
MGDSSVNVFEAILLGAVQGLTEFLPVSSSGHLVLVQNILHIEAPALFFDTLLHGGTLVAVIVVLRRDIWALLRSPFQRLTWLLLIATAVTAVFAFLLKDYIEEAFASGRVLGFAFLFTSAALFIAEYLFHRSGAPRSDAEMGLLESLFIGALQGVAIIPGVSRSGLTLSGALSCKLERDFAARFSFLLSIPAILGALLLQIKELYDYSRFQSVNPEARKVIVGGIDTIPLMAGTLTALLVGFASMVLMMRIVRERSLRGFGVYTAILGLLILLDQNLLHIVF